MTAPGWYHADGDPEGSKRYWDGSQWQGEAALSSPNNEILYYAPTDNEIDLGDVATRVSATGSNLSTSYSQSPYSASTSSLNVTRRKLPELLKNLTILVCLLKAIPLMIMTAAVVSLMSTTAIRGARTGGRFAPPGLDFDSGYALAVIVFIAIIAFGALLTITQGRAALKDQASNLFAIALILLLLDLLNAANQWSRAGQGFSAGASWLATIVFVLQIIVTVWAGFQSRRR